MALDKEKFQNSINYYKSFQGMDELISLIAVFSMGNEDYITAPMVARYGDRWYLNSLSNNLGNAIGHCIDQYAFCPMSDMNLH